MARGLRIVLIVAAALAVLSSVAGVAAAPALSLDASVVPQTLQAGGEVVYTIRAANAGDQDVAGLAVRHTLPAGFSYVPGSTIIALNGIRFSTQEPAAVGQALTWNRLLLPAARSANTFGMNSFFQDKCSNEYIGYQLDRVLQVGGAGAYVKQLLYDITPQMPGPRSCWVYFVNAAYDRGLIPVVRLAGSFGGQYWIKPEPDGSGSYAAMAQAFARVVAGLPRRDGHKLYVEVWNEPNLNVEWSNAPNPAEYGRFLVDTSAAIRALGDSRIVILNAALAPGGNYNNLDFVDAMARVPGALWAFDVWASHPYPANHPPQYNIHDGTARYPQMTIDSYRLELDRLAAQGRTGLRVLLTETGYALQNQDYGFEGYPQIGEANRADYISRALSSYWPRWPEVLGVCPYELVDPYAGWTVWDWLYRDGSHHAQFDAVAALGKPPAAAPSMLTLTFRVRAGSAAGTFGSDVSAFAGGSTLATAPGVAPVTVLPGSAPPPSPTPTPPWPPDCQDVLQNGGLEAGTSWTFMGGLPGGYSTAQARTGARSLRLGLEPGAANVYSYSSAQQDVTLPPGPGTVTLSFWYKPVSNDTVGDQFKVLVRDGSQAFHTLGYFDLAASGWTHVSLDTSAYLGQSVATRLTVVNDGYAGQTAAYVDDLSWTVCLQGTAPPAQRHTYLLPLVWRSTEEGLQAQAAAPAPSTPAVSAAQPAGPFTRYRAVAADPVTGQAYATADDGVWTWDPAGQQAARRLREGSGYQAVLVDAQARRLLVSDRAGDALVALDLGDGHPVAQAPRLLNPGGIAVYGDSIFVAETDADQVAILDRRTCRLVREEPVGPAPYALAVDALAGRIWVANAGGRSVTVLDARSGVPIGAVQLDGLGHPQGIAVDEQGRRVYVTYLLSPRYHALAIVGADDLRVVRVLQGDEKRPLLGAYGVAVEPGTRRILLSDLPGLLALDPNTLAAETLVAGAGYAPPLGLAVDPARGRILAVDDLGPVVRLLQR